MDEVPTQAPDSAMISLSDAYDSGITKNRVIALPNRGRVLLFPSAGGAKPIAGRGGLEGFTPPHQSRRGHRIPTDIRLPPAPRVSAGLRFAVIVLSKKDDVGRDHLIHRKRSPFPYEGKDLTPRKLRRDCNCRARHFLNRGERSVAAQSSARPCKSSPNFERV